MKRPAPEGTPASKGKAKGAKAAIASSPSPSPEPSGDEDGSLAGSKDHFKTFSDADPFYALLGEVGTHKVCDNEGNLNAPLLQDYLERLLGGKGQERPYSKYKDWVEIWAAMDIPVAHQALVLTPMLRYALRESDAPRTTAEGMGDILAELIKGHRTKTSVVQESFKAALGGASDTFNVLPRMLFLIFPKSPSTEWGWSRVGWSWQQWWTICEKTVGELEPMAAFDDLAAVLGAIEAKSGTPLVKHQIWDEKRCKLARDALCKFASLEDESDLVACVDAVLK